MLRGSAAVRLVELAARGGRDERERVHLMAQRAFLLVAALGNPAFGVLRALTEPAPWGSLAGRFALGALSTALLMLSYASGTVRRNLAALAVLLVGIMYGWYTWSAARFGDSAGLIPSLPMLVTAGVAVSQRAAHAVLFTVVVLGLTAAGYGWWADPGIALPRLLTILGIDAFCVGVFVHYRETLERALAAERSRLEARVDERTRQLAEEVRVRERAEAEAQRASRAKTRFLTNMSHEVRTPLNAIVGYTALVRDELRHSEYAGDLAKVEAAAVHLSELFEDVLDLSRIESGSVSLRLEPTRVCDLLEPCIDAVQQEAREKNLEVFMDVSRDHVVRVDPIRGRQVLLNLIGNAVRFTETGGVHVDVQVRGQHIAIHVHDTGCGIEPAALDRAFDRFDEDPRRSHGGTGFGLSISRDLARLMGGDITARSEVGRGSTFTVVLPRYRRRDSQSGFRAEH